MSDLANHLADSAFGGGDLDDFDKLVFGGTSGLGGGALLLLTSACQLWRLAAPVVASPHASSPYLSSSRSLSTSPRAGKQMYLFEILLVLVCRHERGRGRGWRERPEPHGGREQAAQAHSPGHSFVGAALIA